MDNDKNGTYEPCTNKEIKNADRSRISVIQWYDRFCTSLENDVFCDIFEYNLKKYTDTVYKDSENVYNNKLKELFPNIKNERRFKISENVPKIDFNSHLKDLSCPNSRKTYCNISETVSKYELEQFGNLFHKTENDTCNASLTTNKINFDRVQKKCNSIENELTRYDKKSCHNDKKEIVFSGFKTARQELVIQQSNKTTFGTNTNMFDEETVSVGLKRKLGLRRTGRNKFISPLLSRSNSNEECEQSGESSLINEKLKNIEPKMVELIMAEIMDQSPNLTWDDIAGLDFAKMAIKEAVVWPMLRPDIFTGLRRPPKGILLFGPPGTGKTLIGKCVASQSKSTFFSISASSLTSKWIGDGEKMVRALFAVARVHQPSVIFIDEVDSLLTQRSESEHESSRRIKTEFLVQLDGAAISSEERLLIIGATNRPQELDEAARRRFVKRLYIPLPDYQGRLELLKKLMLNEKHIITEDQFVKIAQISDGYSGADIKNLCSEASLEPIRSLNFNDIQTIQASNVRSLTVDDFQKSLTRVRPSVSPNDLLQYIQWDQIYGSGGS
ncbi:fidgetin-like protein 1 [Rhynchophorus ferrugineus]|uniref:fidgetin-like protein 1 n=1 Tax=Rhynchophorus ferrugineus TaxID=354439 RepID=UPI003FCD76C2